MTETRTARSERLDDGTDHMCPTFTYTNGRGLTETHYPVRHDWRLLHLGNDRFLWYCTQCQETDFDKYRI